MNKSKRENNFVDRFCSLQRFQILSTNHDVQTVKPTAL